MTNLSSTSKIFLKADKFNSDLLWLNMTCSILEKIDPKSKKAIANARKIIERGCKDKKHKLA